MSVGGTAPGSQPRARGRDAGVLGDLAGRALTRRDVLRRAGSLAVAMPPLASLIGNRPWAVESDQVFLSVGAIAPATAVDPVTGFDGTAIGLFQEVHEYLIWLEADLTLSPQLATSWEPELGGARWVIGLREGVTFSDGTPFDASTVVACFQRILDPTTGSPARAALTSVLAADGVTAADDYTVVFDLLRPYGDFPYLVSAGTYNTAIVKRDYAGDWATNAIGTGPFLLESYSPTGGARFVRNGTYWDGDRVRLDGIEVKFYRDDQAAVIALQSGEVDTMMTARVLLLPPIEADEALAVDVEAGTVITVLSLRVDTPPFDVKAVRQAVAVALDRGAINTTLALGLGQLGNDHLISPAFPHAPTDLPQRDIDLTEVRRLLDEAGVEDLSFTLTFDTLTRPYAVLLREQLAQAGIEVTFDELTTEAFYAGEPAETPWLNRAATLVPWASRATPTQFVVPMIRSDGVWNGSRYANSALDEAADRYDAADSDEERRRHARTIAQIMHDDVPLVITWWAPAIRPYRTSWRGISAHPAGYLDLRSVQRV